MLTCEDKELLKQKGITDPAAGRSCIRGQQWDHGPGF